MEDQSDDGCVTMLGRLFSFVLVAAILVAIVAAM